jgi:hypothetical protein
VSQAAREKPSLVEQLVKLPPQPRRETMAALLASGVLVAACSQMTQPADIAVAEELCSKRGGFSSVSRHEHGRNLVINCKDGAYLDVRLHDVKGAAS